MSIIHNNIKFNIWIVIIISVQIYISILCFKTNICICFKYTTNTKLNFQFIKLSRILTTVTLSYNIIQISI